MILLLLAFNIWFYPDYPAVIEYGNRTRVHVCIYIYIYIYIYTYMRERERERHMIKKLVYPLESLEDRIAIIYE